MSPITDSAGRILATAEQHEPVARPSGPWDGNVARITADEAKARIAIGRAQLAEIIDTREPYAVYFGKQDDFQGGWLHLYTVHGGPSDGSTLSAESLVALGIAVPEGGR